MYVNVITIAMNKSKGSDDMNRIKQSPRTYKLYK